MSVSNILNLLREELGEEEYKNFTKDEEVYVGVHYGWLYFVQRKSLRLITVRRLRIDKPSEFGRIRGETVEQTYLTLPEFIRGVRDGYVYWGNGDITVKNLQMVRAQSLDFSTFLREMGRKILRLLPNFVLRALRLSRRLGEQYCDLLSAPETSYGCALMLGMFVNALSFIVLARCFDVLRLWMAPFFIVPGVLTTLHGAYVVWKAEIRGGHRT